jgi:hypothetical protein
MCGGGLMLLAVFVATPQSGATGQSEQGNDDAVRKHDEQ